MPVQHTPELKAYEQKITSDLEQAKAKLQELEAYFKSKKAQAEIDTIHGVKATHHDIESKARELKAVGETVAEAKVAQIKAEIDAAFANVNAKLAQLSNKVHTHSTT